MKNVTRETFQGTANWTCPAGVKSIRVLATALVQPQFSAGDSSLAFLNMAGAGYGLGLNGSGQLGDGTVIPKSAPSLITGGLKYRSIFLSGRNGYGITENGDLYGWGNGASGSLGNGTINIVSAPVLVSGGLTWRSVSAGGSGSTLFACGVDSAGNGYAWGGNASGQLGDGTIISKSVPTLITGGLKWRKILCGTAHAIGLDISGNIYSWGVNTSGSLGDGTAVVAKSAPALIASGLLNWIDITTAGQSGSAGTTPNIALKSDGTAWAWGDNFIGGLGTGNTVNRSSPTAVVGGYTWKKIRAGSGMAIGIDTKGNAYSWGAGNSGRTGQGDTLNRSSPTLIAGGNQWLEASCGAANAYLLSYDGKIYGTGDNSSGQLGDGTVVGRSAPTAIATAFNYQTAYEVLGNEIIAPVVPGEVYPLSTLGAASFAGLGLTPAMIQTKITLEYFS